MNHDIAAGFLAFTVVAALLGIEWPRSIGGCGSAPSRIHRGSRKGGDGMRRDDLHVLEKPPMSWTA
jgi:hypothetical protein